MKNKFPYRYRAPGDIFNLVKEQINALSW